VNVVHNLSDGNSFVTNLSFFSPVDSSRFGSSGNLSQASSQLSETGQESAACSELEESYHSYHSTGYRPSRNGHHPTNGHTSWGEDEGLKSSQENGKSISSTIKNEGVSHVDKMPEKTLKRHRYCTGLQ